MHSNREGINMTGVELPRNRKSLTILALHAMALVFGVYLASASIAAGTPLVSAVSNCTHYTNPYTINDGCNANSSMGTQAYQTRSTGLRDSNFIYTAINQWISITYNENAPAEAYGTQLSDGSSYGYAIAQCDRDGSGGVLGRCRTWWHE